MSVVWRGHDEALGRQVAVKILRGVYAVDEASQGLIRAEAQVMAALSHPNLPRVYDYGEQVQPDGARIPFLVMEVVQGHTLADLLARGPLPWPTAVHICSQLAAALAAAHARGLVHRDVKPANVMLTRAGVKLVDFGLAAAAGAGCDQSPDAMVLGTPAYLAPERLTAAAVTPASDVYGLGLVLYRALTGATPWTAATVTQMIRAHRDTEPAPMPAVPGLPRPVRRLCTRCLSKTPAKRPSSAEAARQLRAAAAYGATAPAPSRTSRMPLGARAAAHPGRVRRATVAAAAAAAVAAGLLTANQPEWLGLAGRITTTADGSTHDNSPPRCAEPDRTQHDPTGAFTAKPTGAGTQSALDATPCAKTDDPPPTHTTATGSTPPNQLNVEPPPQHPTTDRADTPASNSNSNEADKNNAKTRTKKGGKNKSHGNGNRKHK